MSLPPGTKQSRLAEALKKAINRNRWLLGIAWIVSITFGIVKNPLWFMLTAAVIIIAATVREPQP